MNATILGLAVSAIIGLIALVWSDALRRVSNSEQGKVDVRLCDERHIGIERRLGEIREDLGNIFGAVESVRIELARMNGESHRNPDANK